MKKALLFALFIIVIAAVGSTAQAKGESFPEKGWHTGPYILVTGGMMQATDDKHTQTNRNFNGTFIPAVGLTFGYDFIDQLGMMLQITYGGFTSDQVGDGTATYPFENAKEHVINLALAARYTFLTHWEGQPGGVRILPYLKLGGNGRALFVNASNDNNKIGAYGGGIAVGAGIEFLIIDRIFLGLDVTENLMFMGSYNKTINGVNTEVVDGGFKPSFQLLGMVGYHF